MTEYFGVTEALLLLAAIALGVGGAALIGYSTRLKRAEMEARLALVRVSLPAAIDRAETDNGVRLVRIQGSAVFNLEQREIARRLAGLGVSEERAGYVYLLIRMTVVFGLGALVLVMLPHFHAFAASRPLTLLTAFAAGIAGWFVPQLLLGHFIKAHVETVVSGLPDALELLVICVEAGLSLEDGISRIVKELRRSYPALAEELALTSADLKILPSRDQAFANLAARIDAPSVRSVSTTLAQTMRYGTPLAQALRMVASEMRNDSLIAMENRANRLPALLTVPMMLFIMPTIFLIVGGPAVLRVLDTLAK